MGAGTVPAANTGWTFSAALAEYPKVFSRLYVNMVKAGELGGVLEVVLNRLSEFMEKAQKIKGKVTVLDSQRELMAAALRQGAVRAAARNRASAAW